MDVHVLTELQLYLTLSLFMDQKSDLWYDSLGSCDDIFPFVHVAINANSQLKQLQHSVLETSLKRAFLQQK